MATILKKRIVTPLRDIKEGCQMKHLAEHPINDEPRLPRMSKDFGDNVLKHFQKLDERNSLLEKQLGPYEVDLAIRLMERLPHLTVEEAIDAVQNIA